MNHAFRIATELVYAHIAYHEAVMAEKLFDEQTIRTRKEAYNYLVRVQNELNAQTLMLAKDPAVA